MEDPGAAATDEPSAQATYRFPFEISSGGPTRSGPGGTWWATHTPDGAGTLRLAGRGPRTVEATAWGPGRHWLLRQVPPLLGASDRPDAFVPRHEVIRRLWSAGPLRLGRTDRVFDAVVGAVLGTRVQVEMARRSLALLAARHGEPAPGPWPQLRLMPSPARLAALTYPELHRCGIERSRAEVLRRVAAETPRLEAAAETGSVRLRRRLLSLTGVGPWTTAGVLAETFGDPDAVLVGDYHVPHLVCWALAREPRGSDDRMLELLEPYAGQRARVIALLVKAGWRAPRRGPRLSFQPVDRYDGSAPDPRANRGEGRATGAWF